MSNDGTGGGRPVDRAGLLYASGQITREEAESMRAAAPVAPNEYVEVTPPVSPSEVARPGGAFHSDMGTVANQETPPASMEEGVLRDMEEPLPQLKAHPRMGDPTKPISWKHVSEHHAEQSAPKRTGKGGGGYGSMSALLRGAPSYLQASGTYFPRDYDQRLKMALASGDIDKKKHGALSKLYKRWQASSGGAFADWQRKDADVAVAREVAMQAFDIDMASAQAQAADVELKALEELRTSRSYWDAQVQEMRRDHKKLEMQYEEEMQFLRQAAPNVMGSPLGQGMGAVAMALGEIGRALGGRGGPNVAMQVIQQGINARVAQAQVDSQRSGQRRNLLGDKFRNLTAKFENERVAKNMLEASLMNEAKIQASAQMRLGTSEAQKKKAAAMVGALEGEIAARDAKIRFELQKMSEQRMRGRARAKDSKIRQRMMHLDNARRAGGNPFTMTKPDGVMIETTGPDGRPRTGFLQTDLAAKYREGMTSYDDALRSIDSMLELEREHGWAGRFAAGVNARWNTLEADFQSAKRKGSGAGAMDKGWQDFWAKGYGLQDRMKLLTWTGHMDTPWDMEAHLTAMRRDLEAGRESLQMRAFEQMDPWDQIPMLRWEKGAELALPAVGYVKPVTTKATQELRTEGATRAENMARGEASFKQ